MTIPGCHVRMCVEGNKGHIVAMEDLGYASWRAILKKTLSLCHLSCSNTPETFKVTQRSPDQLCASGHP